MRIVQPELNQEQALAILSHAPLALSESVVEQLLAYWQLLIKWNQAYNLTAIRDPETMLSRHILDSLSLLPYVEGKKWLDVGTGAGLPGIPLAIVMPQASFTLLDSNGKKTRFLTHVVQQLKLKNVKVLQKRLESGAPSQWSHAKMETDFLMEASLYDAIVSRAFARLGDFLRLTQSQAATKARWFAMKGQLLSEEVTDLPEGFRIVSTKALTVWGSEGKRHLIEIERWDENAQ